MKKKSMGKKKRVYQVRGNYWPAGLAIAGILFAVIMGVLAKMSDGLAWNVPLIPLFFAFISFCFCWQYVRISENYEREGRRVSFVKRLGLTLLTMTIACAVGVAIGKAVSKKK